MANDLQKNVNGVNQSADFLIGGFLCRYTTWWTTTSLATSNIKHILLRELDAFQVLVINYSDEGLKRSRHFPKND